MPMDRLEAQRLGIVRDHMDEDEPGYYVKYSDDYTSWSPKAAFEDGYSSTEEKSDRPNTLNLSFGEAISFLKKGYKVARKGWNGKGMFIYYVKANSYPVSGNPGSAVKGIFKNDMVPYRHYIALKTAQNDIATWSPSTSDALADDWEVINY